MEQTIILDKGKIIGIAYDKCAEKFYKDKGYELKKVPVLQADMCDIKDVVWKVRKTWNLYEDAGDIQDEEGNLEDILDFLGFYFESKKDNYYSLTLEELLIDNNKMLDGFIDLLLKGGDLELFNFEVFSISRNVSREELKEYLNTLYFADECPCLDGMY